MRKFKPAKGQYYYMINSRFQVKKAMNGGGQRSLDRISAGNAFKRRPEAEKVLSTLKQSAAKINKKWWEIWK